MPRRAKRKSRKSKSRTGVAPSGASVDFGVAERAQHGPMVVERLPIGSEYPENRTRIRAIEIDDPLYIYRRNRVISVVQRDAGLTLRELWNRTGRAPRVVAPYQEVVTRRGSAEGVLVTSAEHHRRFVEAMRAVGPIGSDTIVSVVCLQEFIPRGHYEILRRGLDILAKRFGLD